MVGSSVHHWGMGKKELTPRVGEAIAYKGEEGGWDSDPFGEMVAWRRFGDLGVGSGTEGGNVFQESQINAAMVRSHCDRSPPYACSHHGPISPTVV